MLNRIIRIAVAACALFVCAGCIRKLGPAEDTGGAIRFTAGSPLLRDDATKGTLKEGSAFTVGDSFVAWAWHNAANHHLSFGSTTPITLGAGGVWDYAPHQYWDWYDGPDYYDFLAIYPSGKDISHTAASHNSPLLRASVDYDATDDQFDLMAAGLRRTDKSITSVDLTFQHLLSAVNVKVTNSEGSVNAGGYPLTVTLVSCKFNNLITSSPITVTFNGTQLETS